MVEKVVFALIGTKRINAAFDGTKAAESGQLAINIEKLSKGLMTADDVANVLAKTAEAVSKLKAAMRTSAAELNKLITKVYSRTNGVVDVEFAGIGEIKLNESQILGDADQIAKDRYTKFIESKLSEGAAEASKFTLRILNEVADAGLISRINIFKSKLPDWAIDKLNFGYAKVAIKGVSKEEYFAHSAIQTEIASVKGTGISIKPESTLLKAIKVNGDNVVNGEGAWLRDVDTEFKILSEIQNKLGTNYNAVGKITLYTDLTPCPSCMDVIKQFKELYHNIDIEVIYKKR